MCALACRVPVGFCALVLSKSDLECHVGYKSALISSQSRGETGSKKLQGELTEPR